MILGANMVVGSLAAAFWLASFECAINAAGGTCQGGTWGTFTRLMVSEQGLLVWAIVVAGILVFWRGKRMRIG